jgi:hypothetical protein
VLATAVPVAVFIGLIYALYYYLVKRFDRFHVWLLSGTSIVLGSAIAAAAAGVSMPVCLCLVALAPVVTVIGYEWRGHLHQADSLALDAARAEVPNVGSPHA